MAHGLTKNYVSIPTNFLLVTAALASPSQATATAR